jgi:hypothetical protein
LSVFFFQQAAGLARGTTTRLSRTSIFFVLFFLHVASWELNTKRLVIAALLISFFCFVADIAAYDCMRMLSQRMPLHTRQTTAYADYHSVTDIAAYL